MEEQKEFEKIKHEVKQEYDQLVDRYKSIGYSDIESRFEAKISLFRMERKRMLRGAG